MERIGYLGTVVFTLDPPALASFYEKALGFVREFEDGGDIAITVATAVGEGRVQAYLHPGEPGRRDMGRFVVDDVDAAVARVAAEGAAVTSPPQDTPWGTREATLADPEGNDFLLTSA